MKKDNNNVTALEVRTGTVDDQYLSRVTGLSKEEMGSLDDSKLKTLTRLAQRVHDMTVMGQGLESANGALVQGFAAQIQQQPLEEDEELTGKASCKKRIPGFWGGELMSLESEVSLRRRKL